MSLKIVTDSTCDLPEEVIQDLGISVVPLFINLSEKGYLDGVDISRKDFYTNLQDYETHPTTGVPGIDAFSRAYQDLVDNGATEILSIHISESLSATVQVAQVAAREFAAVPVKVLDSGQLSLGTGFQVEEAARMAAAGRSLEEILVKLEEIKSRSFVAAGLKTLEFLRRSGRMSAFMTGLGSFLQLKPILTMRNGLPGSQRVRTNKKAAERLQQMVIENQPIERFGLLHANAPNEAAAFLGEISHLVPDVEIYTMDITPVIGVHIGPGAVGFALVSRENEKHPR